LEVESNLYAPISVSFEARGKNRFVKIQVLLSKKTKIRMEKDGRSNVCS
jgi:hypothetical protein